MRKQLGKKLREKRSGGKRETRKKKREEEENREKRTKERKREKVGWAMDGKSEREMKVAPEK